MNESLQLRMESIDIPDAVFRDEEESGRNPTFTGARFFERYPERYKEIVTLRAEGVPVAAVARMYAVSRNTVDAIDRRESGSGYVEHQKAVAAADCRRLAVLCRERMSELLLNGSGFGLKELAVALGILEEKALLLGGSATSRVEVYRAEEVAGYSELVEAARCVWQKISSGEKNQAQRALEAPCLEIPASTTLPHPSDGAPIGAQDREAGATAPAIPILGGAQTTSVSCEHQKEADGTPAAIPQEPPETGGEGVESAQGAQSS